MGISYFLPLAHYTCPDFSPPSPQQPPACFCLYSFWLSFIWSVCSGSCLCSQTQAKPCLKRGKKIHIICYSAFRHCEDTQRWTTYLPQGSFGLARWLCCSWACGEAGRALWRERTAKPQLTTKEAKEKGKGWGLNAPFQGRTQWSNFLPLGRYLPVGPRDCNMSQHCRDWVYWSH